MYVLNLPKGVRKLFLRNLTLIITMSKNLSVWISLQSLTLPCRTPDQRHLKVFRFATSPFQKQKGKYLTVVGQNRF